MTDQVTTKTCKKCQEDKLLEFFTKNKGCLSGRENTCKKCTGIYNQNYYLINKNKIIERSKKYYADNTEICKERNKVYYKKNTGKCLLINRAWQRNNKEKVKEYRKKADIKRGGKAHKSAKVWVKNNLERINYLKSKSRENLSDSYVKSIITKGSSVKRQLIPKELIELKRINILITREIRKQQQCQN